MQEEPRTGNPLPSDLSPIFGNAGIYGFVPTAVDMLTGEVKYELREIKEIKEEQPIVIQVICEELDELKKQLNKLGFEIDIRPKAVTMGVKLDVDEIIEACNKMEERIHAHQS